MAAKKLKNWSRSIITDEHIVDIIKEYNYPSKPNLHSSKYNSSPIIKEYNYPFSLQLQLLMLLMTSLRSPLSGILLARWYSLAFCRNNFTFGFLLFFVEWSWDVCQLFDICKHF
ncbi:hypothetical protein Peur_039627 [Populus x canadensis]